ncbi:MAG: DUF4091 domain-containing protein [Armatimonadetes bacterium]|nr:DUF4091 domain-containing protein [Armatimonadota bacterium]
MRNCAILAWQPLLRPPLPNQEPPINPDIYEAPIKALTCRNQITSLMALVVAREQIGSAKVVIGDLRSEHGVIPADLIRVRLVGTVPTPEVGMVCDPLHEVDEFDIDKCAALHLSLRVPRGIPGGVYEGPIILKANGEEIAFNRIEAEVANVDLPDARDWSFFLNVWMNPATIARRHGVEVWSEEHFQLLCPYIEDLALHGQKTVVAPICYQPWGVQTRDPYPNSIRWKKSNGKFEFDFTAFDRYIELHEQYGINRAIHCYTIVQGDKNGGNMIEFFDVDAGEIKLVKAAVGDEFYTFAWGSFLKAFVEHLKRRDWLGRAYIGFDERSPETMEAAIDFIAEHAPELKVSLAGNTIEDLYPKIDDLALQIGFNERGVTEASPAERSAMGIAQLLRIDTLRSATKRATNMTTSFYVCSGPEHPNTFLFSPLVESRMLPWLALQGEYDGFLRWSYNDWPDDPYNHPEWGTWPTGDVFFVYPGENGPVSSLRWEQLMEGIADYELAKIASANIREPEEMVDYEQAVTLACRNTDGRTKSVGDIEIARRLLIPIAEH